MASGVIFVALVLSGNEVAAALRADDLDPQIARYAFDEGQASFANARVALGSFAERSRELSQKLTETLEKQAAKRAEKAKKSASSQ